MAQFVMRYKEQQVISEGIVEASGLERGEAVGRAWCALVPTRRFISIRNPVLADESILKAVEGPAPTEWDALTAVERVAASTGKTTAEVLEGMKKLRRPIPALENAKEVVVKQ